VEELADRPIDFKPQGAPGYMHLLPLSEIISNILGTTYVGAQKVWSVYNLLIGKFGDELTVLLETPREELSKIADPRIAEAIIRVREDKARVIPGYDGVYGQLMLFEEKQSKPLEKETVGQRSLSDFI
jgi:PHP family Zn ribbon phosphoesterase